MEVRRDEHAIIRSSRPGSAGLGVQAWSWDSAAFISMWVRSWFKHGVMGELTPGTQLSMGSAKRLCVLMAGFYMLWDFETSAVKSRHRSCDLHLYAFSICATSSPSRHLMFHLCILKLCVRESNVSPEVPLTQATTSQIIPYVFRAEGLSSDCRWEFMFDVLLQTPMTVTEPLGFGACEVVCKCTQTWTEELKHAADVRRIGSSSWL